MASPIMINQFGGINRTASCSDAEFADTENVSTDKFPHLTCSKGRRKAPVQVPEYKENDVVADYKIQCIYPDLNSDFDNFSGIVSHGDIGRFCYSGKYDMEKKFSKKYRYNYPFSDRKLFPKLKDSYADYNVIRFRDCLNVYPCNFSFSSNSKEKFDYHNSYSGTMYFRWYKSREGVTSNEVWFHNGNFGYEGDKDLLKVGDRIEFYYDTEYYVNSCVNDVNTSFFRDALRNETKDFKRFIVSAYITKLNFVTDRENNKNKLVGFDVDLYNIDGDKIDFGSDRNPINMKASSGAELQGSEVELQGENSWQYFYPNDPNNPAPDMPGHHDPTTIVTLKKYAPYLMYSCEYNGRIWGLDPFGSCIYASALGDSGDWSRYDGMTDSPWFINVDSPGKWTGIFAFNNLIYAFKEDKIYIVYGDNAKNFTIAKTINNGCIDNKSITAYNNILYYLSTEGYYALSGSQPYKISDRLNAKYTSGNCIAYNGKLYCSFKLNDRNEFCVFDIDKGVWLRQGNTCYSGFMVNNNILYAYDDKHIYTLENEGIYPDAWSLTSKEFTDNSTNMRGVNSIFLKMKIPPGGKAEVFMRYDNGDFMKAGELVNGKLLSDSGNSSTDIEEKVPELAHCPGINYSQRFPVTFRSCSTYQYKIVFHGACELESIERRVSRNGKYLR